MSIHIRAVVITSSDACAVGEREDTSGETLVQLLIELGAEIVAKEIVNDDLEPLAHKLRAYADLKHVNLIVTTGGTGFGPRDNTLQTLKETPMAMISRGVCGIRSGALIVNLPGSPKAVRESFDVIRPVLAHAIALLEGKTAH